MSSPKTTRLGLTNEVVCIADSAFRRPWSPIKALAFRRGWFTQRFVEERPAISPRRNPFPKDKRELTFAGAWKFAEEGKRTLIFCTQRDHVESYAKNIVDLTRRGFLRSLLAESGAIDRAKAIGAEWMGENHPAVQCLDVGVAIHHARLPNPFLREIERLLNEGTLTVTVASPTLAQGLNLKAAVLLVPNLHRAGVRLSGEEFANVAGRAGRALVDLEGLVVHVMYAPAAWRRQTWRDLVNSSKARNLESGLMLIAAEILQRLARGGILGGDDAFEYLANSREAWDIGVNEEGDEPLEHLLEKLDNTILGLIESLDADSEELPRLIDEALNGSLWSRQIARRNEEVREQQLDLLKARSRLIWASTNAQQRRGHFAMGVGLEAGLTLDEMAEELAGSLDEADLAALLGDVASLRDELSSLAGRLLWIRPFEPDQSIPAGWQEVLNQWLSGRPVREIGPDNIRLIEEAFAYRLVWAIEALRMRRVALGRELQRVAGAAAACLETGLPKLTMAMLVRGGLPSREAAIAAVSELNPVFLDNTEMRRWLKSDEVATLTDTPGWPSPATCEIWRQFRHDFLRVGSQMWSISEGRHNVDLQSYESDPKVGIPYRVEVDATDHSVWVCTPDFRRVVKLRRTMNDASPSVLTARFEENGAQVIVRRLGRSRASWP